MPILIVIKLLLLCISSALFWWGGDNFLTARRIFMPLLLAISSAFFTHTWWVFLAMMPMAGVLTLGYGDKSWFRHCFGNGWGRGVWGFLVALAASLGLFLGHFLAWWLILPYLVLNFILENALKDQPQEIGDPIVGAGLASILFLI